MHARMTLAKHGTESLGRRRVPTGTGEKEPLQIRIPTNVKRAFKARAAIRGIEPNTLFVEVWEHYERTGPNSDATEK
ncbi:hypothetical protein [Acidisoma silvae]|uniref:Uncharacterized protein n=1 Tax=Acidisoma silvae TaxID=2802396 RepID=A0A963YY30_9PROT|nr:hypothetical protein [Acidisoma silvae]MCB8878390.1 hypothetical protein [Acidisoma silvae]